MRRDVTAEGERVRDRRVSSFHHGIEVAHRVNRTHLTHIYIYIYITNTTHVSNNVASVISYDLILSVACSERERERESNRECSHDNFKIENVTDRDG